MPNIDGLALCERLHIEHPHIQFIALSNYDDFNYVYGTLQNGAVDYILKHKISAVTLKEALNKASRSLTQSPKQPDHMLDTNNINALKQEFLIQLLTCFYIDDDEIAAHIQTLKLNLDLSQVLVMIMCIDDYQSMDLKKLHCCVFLLTILFPKFLKISRTERYALLSMKSMLFFSHSRISLAKKDSGYYTEYDDTNLILHEELSESFGQLQHRQHMQSHPATSAKLSASREKAENQVLLRGWSCIH